MLFGFNKVAAVLVAAASYVAAAPAANEVVPGQYIVVFKKDAPQQSVTAHINALKTTKFVGGGAGIIHEYNMKGFQGYAAKIPADAIKKLESDPAVDYVQEDRIIKAFGDQANPTWGLNRLDQRALPLDTGFTFPDSQGAGVDAYIVDTGIQVEHPEFEGRARVGASFTNDNDKDGNGHGTHVAGTVGSKTYGVAKKVSLIAVKVLNAQGSGTTSGVVAGINWVAENAKKTPNRKSVANMSLGGGADTVLDQAVAAAIKAGTVFAVAAGNSAGDACVVSPGRVPEAITVAASDKNDQFASFSEKGSCVDIIAPGVDILSTWNAGNTKTISGTSMATPHVAGVVALALAEGKTAADVTKYLTTIASKNRIKGSLGTTPNQLLYSKVNGGAIPDNEPATPGGGTQPPVDPKPPVKSCPWPKCWYNEECDSCDWEFGLETTA